METFEMSGKERRRLEVLSRVKSQELSLVKGAELLGMSYRQAKRVWARYQEEGDRGLVHRLRGRASNRHVQPIRKEQALELYREKYAGYGPTLAAECLERDEGLSVPASTLREWLSDHPWRRRFAPPRMAAAVGLDCSAPVDISIRQKQGTILSACDTEPLKCFTAATRLAMLSEVRWPRTRPILFSLVRRLRHGRRFASGNDGGPVCRIPRRAGQHHRANGLHRLARSAGAEHRRSGLLHGAIDGHAPPTKTARPGEATALRSAT